MLIAVDTNILLRSREPAHSHYADAVRSVRILRMQGHTLCLSRQNLVEFRNVASRPSSANGLGFAPSDADRLLNGLEQDFHILRDTDAIYARWRALIAQVGVQGKQVHDARLAAAMLVYGVTHLLTFNGGDFARYQTLPATLGGGITVVDPLSL